ncbi:sulfurtransferase TusA family protein [Caulobacter sp. SL161]|uniref:sulfurtransferase TusA family protein n=1 Tax=Caulobacter sp. SL161 TaxID=2995156 RepID=UPI002275B2AD|nr:sulfurtransferase TusA family protein [Caulobacter sp. SL161]MCY1647805.1 sulfurtransferase TusA family protein [Caulobacter sp. SL161]
MPEPVVVDARGHHCPVPTLKLRKAHEAAPAGAELVLLATDPMARIDAPHFAGQVGATVLEVTDLDGGVIRIRIQKAL